MAESWQRWVADNLLRGVAKRKLVAELSDNEVPPGIAVSTVAAIARSPGMTAARRQQQRSDRLALVLRLLGELRRDAELFRGPHPSAADFFRCHWETSTPALFTDIVTRWPALTEGRWLPERLADRFGAVEIEACVGRAADARPDANWDQLRQTMNLRTFIDRVTRAGRTNDVYLIANNRNTHRAELASLWDDVVVPEGWFAVDHLRTGSALWLGPAGTVTPLHHDTSNILFCQVVGRKRVALAPPWSASMLAHVDGVYSRLTLDEARRCETLIELTLQPGEALFIPVGWWHTLEALDVSVSLAINAFSRPNSLEWYRPGSPS